MNTPSIKEKKKQIRRDMFQKRGSLSKLAKAEMDKSICKQLFTIIQKRKARIVHSYLSIGSEVDLYPLIEKLLAENIQVVCPKTLPNRALENRVLVSLDELEEGVMKTFHPKSNIVYDGKFDIIIVPGLAFDRENYRLGYGGGYYDTFLANHPESFKLGLFYGFQEVDVIPREAHDLGFDQIITNS